MSQNKKKFKDDIEAAEKHLLVMCWIGAASALGVILFSLFSLVGV